MATWLVETSTVVAPMRGANCRWAAGGITWSPSAIKNHDGNARQAGTPITSPRALQCNGCWTANMTLAVTGSTSAAKWLTQAAGLAMSVDISARQLQDASIVEDVESALHETGLDAGSLILELTEGAVVETFEEALATLQQLRWMSVQLAMDDFGTGYSSLSTSAGCRWTS